MQDVLDQFEHFSATLVRLFNTPICTLTTDQIIEHLEEIQECTLTIEEHMCAMRQHVYPLLGAINRESE